ncbi:MAG: protein-disulfide reductase DsbD domain-containing protein [Burkholderiaceae bacterium]
MFEKKSVESDRQPRSLTGLLGGLALLLAVVPAIFYFRSTTPGLSASVTPPPAALLTTGRQFLNENDAFRVTATLDGNNQLTANFIVADGYYLYRDKIKLVALDKHAIGSIEIPIGEELTDQFFGKSKVLRKQFEVTAIVTASDTTIVTGTMGATDFNAKPDAVTPRLQISYQGCADDGICYPPTHRNLELHGH